MAIYHLSVKAVSRTTGRSVVAAAAYRSGEKIVDRRTGQEHDYSRRSGVEHTGIVLPSGAPEWARDRAQLWNAAEAAERRKDAKTAREYEVAMPFELSAEQRIAVVREYAGWLAERHGVAVDFAIHAPNREGDKRNHHAHILTTTRELGPDGLGEKTRALDVKTTAGPLMEEARAKWEEVANRALERAQVAERVDRRSIEAQRAEAERLAADRQRPEPERAAAERRAQDLDREALPKLGPTATALERQGVQTGRGDDLRAAQARNAERRRLWEQVREWGRQLREIGHQVVDQVRDQVGGLAEAFRGADLSALRDSNLKAAFAGADLSKVRETNQGIAQARQKPQEARKGAERGGEPQQGQKPSQGPQKDPGRGRGRGRDGPGWSR